MLQWIQLLPCRPDSGIRQPHCHQFQDRPVKSLIPVQQIQKGRFVKHIYSKVADRPHARHSRGFGNGLELSQHLPFSQEFQYIFLVIVLRKRTFDNTRPDKEYIGCNVSLSDEQMSPVKIPQQDTLSCQAAVSQLVDDP